MPELKHDPACPWEPAVDAIYESERAIEAKLEKLPTLIKPMVERYARVLGVSHEQTLERVERAAVETLVRDFQT